MGNDGTEKSGRGSLRARLGMTMVELMAVAVIFSLAILGFVYGLGVSVRDLGASKRSYAALNAARSKIEELQAGPFRELYANYGPGTGRETFPVVYEEEGRTYTLEGPDGGDAGSIIFCVDETAIPTDFQWVGAYELNGDGDADDTDVSTDYRILPVIVRITWVDGGISYTQEMHTVLFGTKYDYDYDL